MPSSLTLEGGDEDRRLRLRGDWSGAALADVQAQIDRLPPSLAGTLICDWSAAESPGIGPTWALLERLARIGGGRLQVRHEDAPRHVAFVETLRALPQMPAADLAPPRGGFLAALGRWSVAMGGSAREFSEFIGRGTVVLAGTPRRPKTLRLPSVTRHLYETGVTAIPIVCLIAFLISVIVAYLGSQQLRLFGAEIFVVDLIAIAVLREMGVLLTAIIVAGRSASAFAAEIGAMQLNEEIDALRAMGMDPFELLVVPRVVALIIALPLLTILADATGLVGGGLLAHYQADISWAQFANRLRAAISPTTFWSGLIKAPVFAALIGVVGAYRGTKVRESPRDLGRQTTIAVVQSIFFVILADAVFAILYVQLNF